MSSDLPMTPTEKPPTPAEPERGIIASAPISGAMDSPETQATTSQPQSSVPDFISEKFLHIQSHSGPMPPPELLAAYAAINPELPIRMMEMAEKSQTHEIKKDNRRLDIGEADMQLGWKAVQRGQYCALAIGLGCLATAVLAIKIAPQSGAWMGGFLGAGGIATLVSAFLVEHRKAKAEPQSQATRPAPENAKTSEEKSKD